MIIILVHKFFNLHVDCGPGLPATTVLTEMETEYPSSADSDLRM